MLEEHVLTDEEKAEVGETFLGLYNNGNYRGALKFHGGLNKPAKAYVNRNYHYELLNARTDHKRERKK